MSTEVKKTIVLVNLCVFQELEAESKRTGRAIEDVANDILLKWARERWRKAHAEEELEKERRFNGPQGAY